MNTNTNTNTKTDKTTKQPVVKMARNYSQSELASLQNAARTKLTQGYYKFGGWIFPCAVIESFTSFQSCIEYVADMITKGHTLNLYDRPDALSQTYYRVSFFKPESEIKTILDRSDLEVEERYLADIAEYNALQVETLTAQLLLQAQKKAAKVIEEKEANMMAAARKEAQTYIDSQLNQQ